MLFEDFLAEIRPLLSDEAEWAGEERLRPIQLVAPAPAAATRVLVVTKLPTVDRALGDDAFPAGATVVGRYGIWTKPHLDVLGGLRNGGLVGVLGDLDPLDLTAWWSLVDAFGSDVRLVGLDDAWLDACALAGLRLDRNTIPLTAFERTHWKLLKRYLPEVTGVIGPKSTALLNSGAKREIEAVLHGDKTGFLRRFAAERLASFAAS